MTSSFTDRVGRPERLFAALVACFGLVYVFLMPPGQAPDESFHFHRAYHVSEGHLIPEMVGPWGGGEIPVSLLQVSAQFANLPLQPDHQTSLANFGPLLDLPLQPEVRRATPFPGSAYYSFVPYLPQALGIALARSAGAGPLALFYAGRLANLALAVVLVFWAIRLTPVFKLVFGLVALIPMTVHQFASQSADASTIGAAFLLTALFLRLAVLPDGRAPTGALAGLFAVAAWLTLCKFPYALLTLVYCGVPVERMGSRRRHAAVGTALLLLVFSLAAAQTQQRKYMDDALPPPGITGASIDGQLAFIRTHPLGYARILAATVAEHGKIWIDQLSMLGWLDTTLNPLAMHLFWTFLVIVALGDRSAGRCPSVRLRLVGLTAALLCLVVILTSCYVVGCAVRSKLVIGPQGRYFLPFLLLLLLPLYNRTLEVRADPARLFAWTAAAGAAIQVVAFAGIVRRYYYPPKAQHWLAPLGLAAAALVFGAVAFWTARRRSVGNDQAVVVVATTACYAVGETEDRRLIGVG